MLNLDIRFLRDMEQDTSNGIAGCCEVQEGFKLDLVVEILENFILRHVSAIED